MVRKFLALSLLFTSACAGAAGILSPGGVEYEAWRVKYNESVPASQALERLEPQLAGDKPPTDLISQQEKLLVELEAKLGAALPLAEQVTNDENPMTMTLGAYSQLASSYWYSATRWGRKQNYANAKRITSKTLEICARHPGQHYGGSCALATTLNADSKMK